MEQTILTGINILFASIMPKITCNKGNATKKAKYPLIENPFFSVIIKTPIDIILISLLYHLNDSALSSKKQIVC
jgi:hypothetical protein